MTGIEQTSLPAGACLWRYQDSGAYCDCFGAVVSRTITLAELVTAFYQSPAFRPERWLLGALLGRGANSQDVARLASGATDEFAAWTVEARTDDQILLCDYQKRTRSWLMVRAAGGTTLLYFGSAVVPAKRRTDTVAFRALIGFHKVYSRILLRSAVKGLGG
jgi:hypothetical protein